MVEARSLAGRVMLVTGAAQRVGEAVARLMTEWGAAGLALIDRNVEQQAGVAAEISVGGCPAEAITADLG